ncbi:hypothetical protein K7X08_038084 [Anisodus acutangulus]|uniref:Uncharacterized protein n=1 Tax=Anisodus acutangulus TaxID=402998 RepID=A0A9Q1N1J5_9SOLA|nr:hypothetical protein K7X08_038084 [Anisodus acutangulus]
MDYGIFADSECSSGCESGWTLYLENSVLPPLTSCKDNNFSHLCEDEKFVKTEQEEEEDLSMVSDASSGPPHFCEEENYGHNNNGGFFFHAPINVTLPKSNPKKQKEKEKQQPSALDDTASSPIFDFSNNNFTMTNDTASVDNVLDFSQGHSTTHFQRISTYQEQYGFFQSSLLPGNQLQENQWFEEKRWGGDSNYQF